VILILKAARNDHDLCWHSVQLAVVDRRCSVAHSHSSSSGMAVLNLGYLSFFDILMPEITNGPTSPWLILGHHNETLSRTLWPYGLYYSGSMLIILSQWAYTQYLLENIYPIPIWEYTPKDYLSIYIYLNRRLVLKKNWVYIPKSNLTHSSLMSLRFHWVNISQLSIARW